MNIILVPGMWLDGSSWDEVTPTLESAGHRVRPLTLPGMESQETDRADVTLKDHIDAVVAVVDAVDSDDVVLVGHSAGAGIVHAAIDARPKLVTRAVYVGGFPTGDGDALADGYPAENGEVLLPDWSEFDEVDLGGLDDAALQRFRDRAIPTPAQVVRDPQQLFDDRRYDVPVTVICTEFTSGMLREWIEQGEASVREFASIRDVKFVDLPTGHWPQFTKPQELARAILTAIS
jgi:pimeloyl-ACP methyl ester carboxylesterase